MPPRPTLTKKVEALATRLSDVERSMERKEQLTEFLLQLHGEELEEIKVRDERLRRQFAELTSKVSGLEEKSRMLEKLSDRGWQIWLAMLGATLALLVALLKR